MSQRPIAALFLVCILVLLGNTARADAATRTWKVNRPDNLWSNPANWEEGAAPVDGDDLHFPLSDLGSTVVNDIPDLQVRTLSTIRGYTINGLPFTLLDSLSGSADAIYNVHITLIGDQTWTLNSHTITLNAGLTLNGALTITSETTTPGSLQMNGMLSGNGSVRVSGQDCSLALPNANTYTGPTFVDGGRVRVGHTNSLGVGDGTIANGTVLSGFGSIDSPPHLSVTLGNELIEVRSIGLFSVGRAITTTGPIRLDGADLTANVGPFMLPDKGWHLSGPLELTGYIVEGGGSQSRLPVLTFVNNNGGSLDLTGAELSLVLPEGFHAPMGQTFTIVDVRSGGPVSGTFAGLPEGATFTAGDAKYAIS